VNDTYPPLRLRRHILLFLGTVATTVCAGAMLTHGPGTTLAAFYYPTLLLDGIPFSLSILAILTAHEFGHYLQARRYGVAATLPYYLPSPLFLLDLAPATFGAMFNPGTFGAVIMTRSGYPDRRALMAIGASGPIAGFVVAVPILAYGISLSNVVPMPDTPGLYMGEPIVFQLLSLLFFGNLSDAYTVMLHPVGIAAWFGCLVTMMNLFPMGQLDGGHILCALTGNGPTARKMQRILMILTIMALAVMGFYFSGWWVFCGMLLVIGRLTGFSHPMPVDDHTPLSPICKAMGLAALAIFILTFMPVPVDIYFP